MQCAQKSKKSLSRQESGRSLTQGVAMFSLLLHRTSVVHVNLFISATTHGPCRLGSTSVENLGLYLIRVKSNRDRKIPFLEEEAEHINRLVERVSDI